MSVLHPPLVMEEAADFEWVLDFDSVDVSANSYACDLCTAPITDGGTVLASLTFDMTSAATGFVTASLAAVSVTVNLDGAVWDLKETTPGPLIDKIMHGVVTVEKKVTA